MTDHPAKIMRQAAAALLMTDFEQSAALFGAAMEVEKMQIALDAIVADAQDDDVAVVPLPIVRRTATGSALRVVGGGI